MSKRKYAVIAKVSKDKFVKYRTNYPDQFIKFLCKKYPGSLWANFYLKENRQLIGSWGSKKGLLMNG